MTYSLSDREKEIIHLISLENTSSQIADRLYISPHTVVSHRKNIFNKLGTKTAAGLIRKCFELGILQVNQSSSIKNSTSFVFRAQLLN